MSLQFVIDGYNIINHPRFSRGSKNINNPVDSLLYLIDAEKLCGSLKNKVTVVFDGFVRACRPGRCSGNIEVVFSGHISADEKIKRIIEGAYNRKNVVVVSDDKEIICFVKLLGAVSMGGAKFLHKLSLQEDRMNEVKGRQQEEGKSLNYTQTHKINEELKGIWLK